MGYVSIGVRWPAIVETSDPLYSDKENERRRIFGVPSVVVVIYIFSGRMVELFGLQHNN